MILLNQTGYDRKVVYEIVSAAFGLPHPVPHDLLAIRLYEYWAGAYHGICYDHVRRMRGFVSARSMQYYIAVGVRPDLQYPVEAKDVGGMPAIEFADWQELLLAAVAHEAYHVYRFEKRLPHREVDAERFAMQRLDVWREAAMRRRQ